MLIPGADKYLPEHHFNVSAKRYGPSSPPCNGGGEVVLELRSRQQGVIEAGSGGLRAESIEVDSKLWTAILPLPDLVMRQVVDAA